MAALTAGRVSAGDPSQHAVDCGSADDRFGDFGLAFVVVGKAAVRGEPGQGSLHHSVAGMHSEADLVGGLADDLDGGLERGGGPVDEPAGKP